MTHPIENIMKTTMENIKAMVDVNTIVGEAIVTTDGSTIIPISKVCFGFVAGGGEYGNPLPKSNQPDPMGERGFPFAGGTGTGVSINPMAFLVVTNDRVELMPVTFSTPYDRIIETVPKVLTEIQHFIQQQTQKQQQ